MYKKKRNSPRAGVREKERIINEIAWMAISFEEFYLAGITHSPLWPAPSPIY